MAAGGEKDSRHRERARPRASSVRRVSAEPPKKRDCRGPSCRLPPPVPPLPPPPRPRTRAPLALARAGCAQRPAPSRESGRGRAPRSLLVPRMVLLARALPHSSPVTPPLRPRPPYQPLCFGKKSASCLGLGPSVSVCLSRTRACGSPREPARWEKGGAEPLLPSPLPRRGAGSLVSRRAGFGFRPGFPQSQLPARAASRALAPGRWGFRWEAACESGPAQVPRAADGILPPGRECSGERASVKLRVEARRTHLPLPAAATPVPPSAAGGAWSPTGTVLGRQRVGRGRPKWSVNRTCLNLPSQFPRRQSGRRVPADPFSGPRQRQVRGASPSCQSHLSASARGCCECGGDDKQCNHAKQC